MMKRINKILFILYLASHVQAKAGQVDMILEWGSNFYAKDSSGKTLSTVTTNLKLGKFDVIPSEWSSINCSNVYSSFTTLSSLLYSGTGLYLFNFNTEDVSSDPTEQRRAFLLVESGASELGIFSWATPNGHPFYLPRDRDIAPADSDAVDTTFGSNASYIFNMVAFVGSVSTSGLQTASVPEPSSLSLLTLGGILVALSRRRK